MRRDNDIRLKYSVCFQLGLDDTSQFTMLRFKPTSVASFSGMPRHFALLYVDGKRVARVTQYGEWIETVTALTWHYLGKPKDDVPQCDSGEAWMNKHGFMKCNDKIWIKRNI